MPDLKVETWPIERLRPFADNARVHDEKQVLQMARSLQTFGFVNPILVDADGEIIAGHGRLQAAQSLERTEVPVIVLGHLTPKLARAYRLADNQIPLGAVWNDELYRQQLAEFMAEDFDMTALGWDAEMLDEFMHVGNPGLIDADEAPAAAERPIIRTGEIWSLGEHRLMCGDCTSRDDVHLLMGRAEPQLMVTDPPYGVDYNPRWRLEQGINRPHQVRAEGRVENDTRADWREAWALYQGDVAYVWSSNRHLVEVAHSLTEVGFALREQIVWAKPSLVIGRGNYHGQHEPCWYAVRNTAHWSGGRKQSTLWHIQNMHRTQGNVDDGKTDHSAQKPVECMKRPIANNSRPGDYVYDPFVGSGTTIIAAEQLGRRALAIEINPAYAQMSVERWQNFTGHQANLNGKNFAEVFQERSQNETRRRRKPVSGKNNRGPVAQRKVRKAVPSR